MNQTINHPGCDNIEAIQFLDYRARRITLVEEDIFRYNGEKMRLFRYGGPGYRQGLRVQAMFTLKCDEEGYENLPYEEDDEGFTITPWQPRYKVAESEKSIKNKGEIPLFL